MILTVRGLCGNPLSLDVTATLGPSVELQSFQFVVPPIEFRVMRQGVALQEWQAGNTEMYDLQHGPGIRTWCRDGQWFINDLNHRMDVATCGVLSKDLILETRGLALEFLLLVWPREGTFQARSAESLNSLTQIVSPINETAVVS
jgi:hypothetical protein